MSGQHDLGYKLLFAHPELVRELITGFTPFAELGELAPACFERVNPAYASDAWLERSDDIVWRVRVADQWIYVYILIEFQSRVDRWMALRMQVYVGLLYQDLVKRHDTVDNGLLPSVLPLVFYNGAAPWTARCEVGELIVAAPHGLLPFQPAQRYCLVDQRRLDQADLARRQGVLAMLFRLELSDRPDVVLEALVAWSCWFNQREQDSLRQDVAQWVQQLLRREPALELLTAAAFAQGGMEMNDKKFATWAEMFEDRGRQQGLQQGLQLARSALCNMLRVRFGALADDIEARIDAGSFDELTRWSERALSVPTPAALFAAADRPGGAAERPAP